MNFSTQQLANMLSALEATCRFNCCVLDSASSGQRSRCCWGIWRSLCWAECKGRRLLQVTVEERSEPPAPCSASATSGSCVTTRSWISLPIWKKMSFWFWWVTFLWARWAGSVRCAACGEGGCQSVWQEQERRENRTTYPNKSLW